MPEILSPSSSVDPTRDHDAPINVHVQLHGVVRTRLGNGGESYTQNPEGHLVVKGAFACLTCGDVFCGAQVATLLEPVLLRCHTSVMRRERVHQAAARLSVSSRRLLVYLDSHGMPHGTATSVLSAAATTLLEHVTTSQVLVESARHHRYRPRRRPTFWIWEDDDDYWGWDDRRIWHNWVGPDELTTAEAAWAYAVTPVTIRQWVHRGHLVPLRRQGRTMVFAARAVYGAAMDTGERNTQPGGPLTRDQRGVEPAGRFLSADAMGRLVTAETAATAVGVSSSTIRSWRHRGLITATRHQGRTPLYLLADVVATARRSPHHSPRKQRPVF